MAPLAWKSFKFKRPGLWYEVAICNIISNIVQVLGLFPCGTWPDVVIFCFNMKFMSDDGECVEAEDGYQSNNLFCSKAASIMVTIKIKIGLSLDHLYTAITRQLTKDNKNSSALTPFSVTMLNSMVSVSMNVLLLLSWPLVMAIHFLCKGT